ncbi:WD repeat-containing protein 75-like [Ostrea edulis]|uniref:WD repeat-containing protein 75-like n=1 Tax=Ostrea edulis TaxID=37623 RepID=UPI0024AF2800|nr:WD repeat-containing protein 75-like [Ostrea edulis]
MGEDNFIVANVSGSSIIKHKPTFSLDSRCLFVISGKNIKVFNVNSGECMHYLTGHHDEVTGVIVSPKNKLQLFSSSIDETILLWDYVDGVQLKRYSLHAPLHGLVGFAKDETNLFVMVHRNPKGIDIRDKNIKHYYDVCEFDPKSGSLDMRLKTIVNRKLVGVGAKGRYLVAAKKKKVFIYDCRKCEIFRHSLSDDFDKAITCVTCHPTEDCFVTGCQNGKIIHWWNFLTKNEVVKSVYSWHALSVLDLQFTDEGSQLLSGGHECVLVKWQYNSKEREFLPRLRAPIGHVVCSPDNQVFATCHQDNCVNLISNTFELLHVIDGLSLCHLHTQLWVRLSVRLLYDPRTKALVTNGRVGHLQFYSIEADKQLYDLDIVQENYTSPEDLSKPLYPTEVTNAAFSSQGEWLATVDVWDDGVMSPDIQLKFWMYQEESQEYILNTIVHYPHDKKVVDLKFRPHGDDLDVVPTVVTSGGDGKFKTWTCVDDSDIYRKNTKWICHNVGYYKDRPAGPVSFSEDGSLLAVGFSSTVTIWDTENNVLRHCFNTHSDDNRDIKFCEFGHQSCCHLLVSVSDDLLCVWNLLTCAVVWSVQVDVSVLATDPLSPYMAVIDSEQKLYVFKPSSSDIVYSKPLISKSPVTCAIFIPQTKGSTKGKQLEWQTSSQLYFFNEEQELQTVVNEEEEEKRSSLDPRAIQENLPSTPFSVFLGGERKSVQDTGSQVARLAPSIITKQILESAPHAQPPVTSLCLPFLQSLILGKQTEREENEEEDEDEIEVKSQNSDSDMEVEQSLKSLKIDSQNAMQKDSFDWLSNLHVTETNDVLNSLALSTKDWISEIKT